MISAEIQSTMEIKKIKMKEHQYFAVISLCK